jgi:hypothetical protein
VQIIFVNARSLIEINFPENLFHFSKEATIQQELKNNQHKHFQIMCRFELDIGSGRAESTVESDLTLEVKDPCVLTCIKPFQ